MYSCKEFSKVFFFCFLIQVRFSDVTAAADPVVSFSIKDTSGQPGETVQTSVLITNTAPLQAFSVAFTFDAASVELKNAVVEGTASAEADYFFYDTRDNAAGAGVVFSEGEEDRLLQAGEDQEVLGVSFAIKEHPEQVFIPVDFEDRIVVGQLPIYNVATVENDDVYPDTLSGGTIEITLPPVFFQRGDANVDGIINIADPVVILSYLFVGYEVSCMDALDVDDSGNIVSPEKTAGNKAINLSDVIYLLKYLFDRGDPPLPPFNDPKCGIDPTADLIGCEFYRLCAQGKN